MPLAALAARIGEPEITVAIDRPSMWKDEHPLAPGFQKLAVGVVLQDRRFGPACAGIRETAMNDIDAAVG
jgi:hypothetical protein